MQLHEVLVHCPYCGEAQELAIDDSVFEQRYIEDCSICCRPMTVCVKGSESGAWQVEVFHENEA